MLRHVLIRFIGIVLCPGILLLMLAAIGSDGPTDLSYFGLLLLIIYPLLPIGWLLVEGIYLFVKGRRRLALVNLLLLVVLFFGQYARLFFSNQKKSHSRYRTSITSPLRSAMLPSPPSRRRM